MKDQIKMTIRIIIKLIFSTICLKNNILLFSLIAASLSFSGCISGNIAGAGKRYDYLLNSRTTVEKVRKNLGEPSWRKEYSSLTQIKQTPEFLAALKFVKEQSRFNSLFVWDGIPYNEKVIDAEDRQTALCEVYTRKGPYRDISRGQAYGQMGGDTWYKRDCLHPSCYARMV